VSSEGVKLKIFLDGKLYAYRRMSVCPQAGDIIRFDESKYGKVNEVVWCLDEPDAEGQRVNIGAVSEKPKKAKQR